MRQVPCYLIIGNGRLAHHFVHYFSLLSISYLQWHRGQPLDLLAGILPEATHILVLISDGAIESFIEEHLIYQPRGISNSVMPAGSDSDRGGIHSKPYLIHCSGSLNTELAYGVHPLMTFSNQLYDLNQYQSFPFIIDSHAPDREELLPGIPNPDLRIDPKQKSHYHALCVLSGNFSCLLWQKIINEFSQTFNWPKEHVFPYMQQQTLNLIHHGEAALTGPLVRGDRQTIDKNLKALADDPFAEVYQSFVNAYNNIRRENDDH